MKTQPEEITVYDLSVNALVTLQVHSTSNAGSNGTNRLLPRRQLLATGEETDACSGNIAKHHHAVLFMEYCTASGISICPACACRDGRRAAALVERPEYQTITVRQIVKECAICDTHGFLITPRSSSSESDGPARRRMSKHSLVEFSFALALPSQHFVSPHLITRVGASKEEGQMLLKMPARAGAYALCVRYKAVGVGVDTDTWSPVVTDNTERTRRHQAILAALRDQLLSPMGAMTSTMLPHLSGLQGVIMIRTSVGRAPIYSPLESDFIPRLTSMASATCLAYPFQSINDFSAIMEQLINTSIPSALVSIR